MDRSIRSTGFSRMDAVLTLVVLAGLAFFGSLFWPAYQRARFEDSMARCGGNLSTIGKAIAAYANDYDGALPVAGGRGTRRTGYVPDWSAGDRFKAFALDPNGSGGEATISSSLYLLVRGLQLDPASFVCPMDTGTQRFTPSGYRSDNKRLADLWDFGPNPAEHCSYAYDMVYGPHTPTIRLGSEGIVSGGFGIAADRNPWMDGPAGAGRAGEFSNFVPDLTAFRGTSEQARLGNAAAHQRDGQNVLFLDTHVSFERRAYCGVYDDNTYTSWDGKDRVRGKPPKLGSQPADARDSLLVNDPPAPMAGHSR